MLLYYSSALAGFVPAMYVPGAAPTRNCAADIEGALSASLKMYESISLLLSVTLLVENLRESFTRRYPFAALRIVCFVMLAAAWAACDTAFAVPLATAMVARAFFCATITSVCSFTLMFSTNLEVLVMFCFVLRECWMASSKRVGRCTVLIWNASTKQYMLC